MQRFSGERVKIKPEVDVIERGGANDWQTYISESSEVKHDQNESLKWHELRDYGVHRSQTVLYIEAFIYITLYYWLVFDRGACPLSLSCLFTFTSVSCLYEFMAAMDYLLQVKVGALVGLLVLTLIFGFIPARMRWFQASSGTGKLSFKFLWWWWCLCRHHFYCTIA